MALFKYHVICTFDYSELAILVESLASCVVKTGGICWYNYNRAIYVTRDLLKSSFRTTGPPVEIPIAAVQNFP